MTIPGHDTRPDLILLDMLDFNIIWGMDWLSAHHAVLDCYAKTIILALPGIPPILWQGAYSRTRRGLYRLCKPSDLLLWGVYLT